MKRVVLAAALGASVVTAVTVPALAKTTWKSKANGKTFRITLDDDGYVTVADKSIMTGRTMNVRDSMRTAVEQATGCQLADELWFGAKMKGKFACPDGGHPKPPVAQ